MQIVEKYTNSNIDIHTFNQVCIFLLSPYYTFYLFILNFVFLFLSFFFLIFFIFPKVQLV